VPLVGDLAVIDPAVVDPLIEKYAWEGEGPDETWGRLSGEPLRDQSWERLAAQVNAWCSPFKGVDQSIRSFEAREVHWLDHRSKADRELTLMPELLGDRIFTLNLHQLDPVVALMVETRIGSVDPDRGTHGNVVELAVTEGELPVMVHLAITGAVHPGTWELHTSYLEARGLAITPSPPPALTVDELIANTPLARSRRWTTRVGTAYEDAPIVCVLGNTAEDHALAVLCDRVFHYGAWVPGSLLRSDNPARRAVKTALHSLRHLPRAPDRPVMVISLSEPIETVTSVVDELNGMFPMYELDGTPVSTEPYFQAVSMEDLSNEPGRYLLADQTAFALRRTVPVRDNAGELSILTPLSLPLPEVAAHVDEPGWCIDVWVRNYHAPARTALPSRSFLQDPPGVIPEAVTRSGRHGVTFRSSNMGFVYAGVPPEGRLAHPLLRFPSAEQIFSELAAANGATTRRSDAGRRAANAVELWGDLDAMLADLSGSVRKLLNAFLPPKGKRNGFYGRGYAVRDDGHLTFAHAVTALELEQDEAREILDRLLLANVLRRGLILNCERCNWEAFYRIDQLGPLAFICTACGHVSNLTHGRWYKHDPEPTWNYALDQVVRDLLRQHGDIALLAVARLRQPQSSLLWSPELIIEDTAKSAELDICAIIDGRVIVGEAKSNGRLGTGNRTPTSAATRLVHAAHTHSPLTKSSSPPAHLLGLRAHAQSSTQRCPPYGSADQLPRSPS
jgi:hypothetical protein